MFSPEYYAQKSIIDNNAEIIQAWLDKRLEYYKQANDQEMISAIGRLKGNMFPNELLIKPKKRVYR